MSRLVHDVLARLEKGEGELDAHDRESLTQAIDRLRLELRTRDDDALAGQAAQRRGGNERLAQPDEQAGRTPPERSPSEDLLRELRAEPPRNARYRNDGEIARGGMGAIFNVFDPKLRRSLAMKVALSIAGDDARQSSALARFLEEAQVTGQLDHPGIVPVHELGLDSDGRAYFTMKLVKGRDLKHIFDMVFAGSEGWNETRALGVIQKVCEAMAYAHAKGVIHRDLKPANVMVGSFGEVYVMDWGLSRVLGSNDKHDIRIKPEFTSSIKSVKTERRDVREDTPDSPIVTMDGDVMGTPAYMSPEQARGEIEKLGPQSDVYSIGAMLYHLLAQQVPYVPRGEKITNRTVLARVLDGPPKQLTSIRAGVPAELVAVCEKAMARDPRERYPDTLVLAEDLRAFLEHRVVNAYETGAWAEARKWVGRNKPLAAMGAAAVLALIAGLVWALLERQHASRMTEEANRTRMSLDQVTYLISLERLRAIHAAMDLFSKLNGGRYPESLDWLTFPDRNGTRFLDPTQVVDPWNRSFLFKSGKDERARPFVYTLGRDGLEGGEGADRDLDISSMEMQGAVQPIR